MLVSGERSMQAARDTPGGHMPAARRAMTWHLRSRPASVCMHLGKKRAQAYCPAGG